MNKKNKTYIFNRIFILMSAMGLLLSIALIQLFLKSKEQINYIYFAFYIISILIIIYLFYEWFYKQYKETNKVLNLFYNGYILKGVFDLRTHYNKETRLAFEKFSEIIGTKELIEGSKKHAEYLALQNQINPHFLYNTLEGIRSEALIEGIDSIANMTEALATFFRYTITNVDKFVTLEDELLNIENYYKIQEFRFGDKLNLNIDFKDSNKSEVLKAKIPKLTLQPIFENAIVHGLEKKLGNGNLIIKIVGTNKRLIITISDDGIGMTEDRVKKLNGKLTRTSLNYMNEDKTQNGIALLNVNNRIKLIFGDEYGIYIYSRLNAGTDVEITVPFLND